MVFIRIPLQHFSENEMNKPTLDFGQILQHPVISRMHTLDGS